MREARYYTKLKDQAVQCLLCPNFCYLPVGSVAGCLSRQNIDGVLYTINYSRTIALSSDPIEKKPLYHYHPGSKILSVGANSCNLHCDFCQNATLSQVPCHTSELTPAKLLSILQKGNLQQIAFTYTEPFTWYEYILDFATLAAQADIRIVLVTNGYINPEPLHELLPFIDAMNIDLKGMSEEFYQSLCAGKLAPVLETIKAAYARCHIEITNLLIPGVNDSDAMISALVTFIADLDCNIPVHLSRYFPCFRSDRPQTPEATLQRAYLLAKRQLHNVYLGNIDTTIPNSTVCKNCGALLIERRGYHTAEQKLVINNKCGICKSTVNGRF